MTIFRRNDKNTEGMTIIPEGMFLQLALLPPLGHKKAIGTLGYTITSKLEFQLAEYLNGDTGFYNTDAKLNKNKLS